MTNTQSSGYPTTLSVEEAARMLGISRSMAYALARADEFPVPLLRAGRLYRVPTLPLVRLLGIEADAS